MAEAMDDLDFSSPPGSPSSSLPQSIRDVLESVRAECGVYDSGQSASLDVPPLITWSDRPYNTQTFNTKISAKAQKKFDVDVNETVQQQNRLKRKISSDPETPNQRTPRQDPPSTLSSFNVQEIPSHQSETINNELQKGNEKNCESDDDVVIIDLENLESPPRTKTEQPQVPSSPGHELAKVGSIKNVGSRPDRDESIRTSDESHGLMSILGGKQAVGPAKGGKDCQMLRAQSYFSSLSGMHETANCRIENVKNNLVRPGVQNGEVVTIDLDDIEEDQQTSLGVQPEHPKLTGIPWYKPAKAERWIGGNANVQSLSTSTSENTSINNNTPTTKIVDENLKTSPEMNSYPVTARVLQEENNQDQIKYGRFTDQLREHEATEFVDLTDDCPITSPKSKVGINTYPAEQTTGVQYSYVQKTAEEQSKEKLAQIDSPTGSCYDGSVISIEADELDAVCYTEDGASEEIPDVKLESNDCKPGYVVASADSGDVNLRAVESTKIKLEYFSDEEIQPKEVKYPISFWKQELLSSDFNLMYGTLRAVLMTTISKNDRNRLIQTMITTMGEIEQVIMHDRHPTEQSVRCASPEGNGLEDEKNTSQSSKLAAITVKKEKPPRKRKQTFGDDSGLSLRQKEWMINQKRSELLMRRNADGTLTCLVCDRVREVDNNGVCRACLVFTYRIEKAYSTGVPLPTCDHTKYSGGVRCRSCRFRKFSFMSMTATEARVRDIGQKTCYICEKTSYSFRNAWQCYKCFYFFMKLNRRKVQMPYCKHSGQFPKTCDGCRCFKLQMGWHKYETRPYPLPIVKKHLFNVGLLPNIDQ